MRTEKVEAANLELLDKHPMISCSVDEEVMPLSVAAQEEDREMREMREVGEGEGEFKESPKDVDV